MIMEDKQGIYIFQLLDAVESSPPARLNHAYTTMMQILQSQHGGEVEPSSCLEDLLLLYLLTAVHAKLPAFIREKYSAKMGAADKQMQDFKSDILADAELFLSRSDVKPTVSSLQENEVKFKKDLKHEPNPDEDDDQEDPDPLGENEDSDVDHVKTQPQDIEMKDFQMKLENTFDDLDPSLHNVECNIEEFGCDDGTVEITSQSIDGQMVPNSRAKKRKMKKMPTYHVKVGDSFQCKLCEFSSHSRHVVRNHSTKIHGGIEHKCDLCDYTHHNSTNLRKHVKRVHLKKRFKCDECDFEASSRSLLKPHKESKHMGIRHFCDKCTKSFSKKSDLKDHIGFVHENTGLQCELCDFRYMYNSELKMHIESKHPETGSEEKKFLCDQCNYATDILSKLNKHVKNVHSDHLDNVKKESNYPKKRIECEFCDYTTHWQPHLSKHMENKHGTKEFLCDQCDYKTRNPAEFSRHWKYRHDPNSKRVPCHLCHFSATRADALKVHVEIVHEGKRVACSYVGCDYAARTKGDLVKHTQAVHEKIRYNCELCEFSCGDKFYLKKHVKNKHTTVEYI